VLRGCGTDHLTAPAQVSGTPGGPPRRAEIVPQQAGCAPQLGHREIPQGLYTRPPQVADGCIVDGGDVDGVRAPERISRARCRASRRSVVTRSPGFVGI
jgi:hypothetical protein